MAEVRRFPGQEQQVYDYYRKNPQALASLRAPVYENKVVDFVAEKGKPTDKPMTREELGKLIAADEDEVPEEHDHTTTTITRATITDRDADRRVQRPRPERGLLHFGN